MHPAYKSLYFYKVPVNLSYFWNFGVYSLVMLLIQLLSGIFLAMFYIPSAEGAFLSVEHIMRDIELGWLLRYTHSNGASFFFIVVYIHVLRGLYYGSFLEPHNQLWFVGSGILLVMIIVAFLGYVLPWGQMSFWAATVITNLISIIPFIGTDLVVWLWGGYAVGHPTLNRFFSLHYFLAIFLVFLVASHIMLLHNVGSNNPLGVSFIKESCNIYPYYFIKDFLGILIFLSFFIFFLFFQPNFLGHPDNYIPANPLVTPSHIVPEWYFLPFYAVLRCVPNKALGVLLMLSMIVSLFILPVLCYNSKKVPFFRSAVFKPLSRIFFWFFVLALYSLGWAGMQPIGGFNDLVSFVGIFFYFSYLLYWLPFAYRWESLLLLPDVWESKFLLRMLAQIPLPGYSLYSKFKQSLYNNFSLGLLYFLLKGPDPLGRHIAVMAVVNNFIFLIIVIMRIVLAVILIYSLGLFYWGH